MSTNYIYYLALTVAFTALFIAVSLRHSAKTTTLFDFFLHGGDLRRRLFASTLVATNAGLSGAFLLFLYYGYLYGLLVIPWCVAFWLITQCASYWTVKQTEKVTSQHGGWIARAGTLHDFLGFQFGSGVVRRIAAVLSGISYVGLVACELNLSYYVLSVAIPKTDFELFGYNAPLLMFLAITFFSIAVYCSIAGFRGVVATDYVQLFLIFAMLIVVAGLAFVVAPQTLSAYPDVFQRLPTGLWNPDGNGTIWYILFVASNLSFWGFWWPGAMDQWQRCAATKSPEKALNWKYGTVGLYPSLIFAAIAILFVFAGAWLRSLTPQEGTPTPNLLAQLILSIEALGVGGGVSSVIANGAAGIVFVGLFAAALSTMDTYISTATYSLFHDALSGNRTYGYANPVAISGNSTGEVTSEASVQAEKELQWARMCTIVVSVIIFLFAALFGISGVDPYIYIYASFAFMFCLLPTLFVALLGKALPHLSKAASISMLGSGVFCLIGYLIVTWEILRIAPEDSDSMLIAYQLVYWLPTMTALFGAGLFFGASLLLGAHRNK